MLQQNKTDDMEIDNSNSLIEVLKNVKLLQEQRVMIYKSFEKSYEAYITKMFSAKDYQISCKMVTEGFKQIMEEIDSLAKKIEEDLGNEELASLIKKLQTLEREKLKSTVAFQMKSYETLFGQKDLSDDVEKAKENIDNLIEEINEINVEISSEMAALLL
ncbi:hypothetical protein BCR36DRAFT_403871 [Piromyces finnis]|uniref:Uncharacterized protein n=1 Tax=Piromyces finnis TaxID=1754191 RepID=A0A1Y1VBM2_9FUNG|nr:hypothetical protein BCR36DRAFT_403871 [Piromyces finnis]|eukprot:ORX52089.1 hypothetical protein BCR36DRAFT_403871 [Piromyces finnis]